MRTFLALFVLSAMAGEAHALTGTQLYEMCTSAKGSNEELTCLSYVRGVVDGMMIANEVKFCPPDDGIDVTQARLIAEKYLRDHPETLNKQAGLLVGAALVRAFHCKSK